MVSGRVGHNEKARLAKSLLNLIGECSRGEPAGNGIGSSVVSKLQDGSLGRDQNNQQIEETKSSVERCGCYLAILPVGKDTDVAGIFNGSNDPGS